MQVPGSKKRDVECIISFRAPGGSLSVLGPSLWVDLVSGTASDVALI
jgi:hypothetical protein